MVGLIQRSFSFLSPEMFKILYTTFVRPYLEYAQVVWSPKLCKHINLIESVQRRATKTVGALKNLSYEERLQFMNIPTLKFRCKIKYTSTFMYTTNYHCQISLFHIFAQIENTIWNCKEILQVMVTVEFKKTHFIIEVLSHGIS